MVAVGRKGRDHFKKKANIVAHHTDVLNQFDISLACEIGNELNSSFTNEEYDELYVAYNVFHHIAIQKPKIERLLPIGPVDSIKELEPERRIEYIYEPSEEVLINNLLPSYIRIIIFRALLETSAGENGARMVAMNNATNNCEEMIRDLTLKYNKARQQAITAELMDIVAGTEALAKG
jgi:F-type H+-transporting ATPase subunit gamma